VGPLRGLSQRLTLGAGVANRRVPQEQVRVLLDLIGGGMRRSAGNRLRPYGPVPLSRQAPAVAELAGT